MDKNKSIDGLSTRRSKRTVPSSNQPPMKTAPRAKKASVPKPIKPAIRPTVKPAAKKTPPKATPKPVKPPVSKTAPKTSPKTRADITADFLRPVQAFNFDSETGKLSVSEEPMSKPEEEPKKTKPKKIKKPWSKKRRIITWTITVIFIIIGALASWLILWGNDIIAKITSGQGNIFDLIFPGESYVELKADENGRTNILAFGTSGYTMDGEYGNGIHDGAQLTDSLMVLSFNQSTNDLVMLSLPRDLKASPTCTATSKINEIYWCNNMEGNNELAGAEALTTEVGAILGIDFQYFAHLNWGALVHIVNTLGGITVTLDEDISDYYFTGAVFKAGEPYTINGEQALGLARARHGTASSDFSRGASQQKILIGIKDRITEKGLSISDMISLAGTLGDNLRTNFSIDEMKSIANLTKNFDMNRIRQISL
ncbi:LCP family protein, partial [Candidatus Saccharibacteria bacterium]|nr:LCP family protein [Candidatus Saccharibacteria bacterium]